MRKTENFKHKKAVVGAALFAALGLVLFIASDALGSVSASDTAALSAGQSVTYATITSIEGNEITYTQIDSDVVEKLLKRQEEQDSEKEEKQKDESRQKDQTSGDCADGEKSSGGEKPSGMEPPSQGEMPSADETSSGVEMPSQGESAAAQIPVGTTVHTTTDTTTTFSRLRSGDFIKILLDTDSDGNQVISEIWMLQ